ncbi:MAG: DHHA1 domain-containing protein [Candidatus Zixiibacteriota bacterium]
MTERIYYTDSYVTEFEAKVLRVESQEGVHRVELDRTAFYPTSGGQLYDVGTIDGVAVSDVIDEGESIWHYLCAGPAFAVGDTITGKIDWVRRRDNMQKHTGQHILSQAFVRMCKAETVSARLGEDDSTVDLNVTSLTDEQIRAAEQLANEIIFENRPVTVEFVSPERLKELPLRKIPDKEKESYRIVSIADFDWSTCGGTHCERTGAVGIIKVTVQEAIRGNVRLHFLTGFGALADYRDRFEQIEKISNTFSRHSKEAADAVASQVEQYTALKREFAAFRKQMMPVLVEQWMQEAKTIAGRTVVVRDFSGQDFNEAKEAAVSIINSHEAVALLVVDDKLIAAANKAAGISAADIIRSASELFGGKGGGSPQVAQGGGFRPDELKVLLAEPEKVLDI